MPDSRGRRAPDRRLPDRRPRRRRAAGQPPRATTRCPTGSPPPGIPIVARRTAAARDRRRATSTSTTGRAPGPRSTHLIAGGRRVIATIAGPADMAPASTGWPAIATPSPRPASGRDPEPRGDRATSPRRAAPRRWNSCSPPDPTSTRVFAASDLMAAGALGGPRRRRPARPRGRRGRRLSTTRPSRRPSTPAAHQRPPADRGDGPRDGPPARRCRRGLRSRAAARDPGHRTGTARIERREAHALSRPATGGRRAPPASGVLTTQASLR